MSNEMKDWLIENEQEQKAQFIKYMNIYKAYHEYEDKLYNLGINIWERDEIGNLITCYIDMLIRLYEDEENGFIEYFIYELNFGEYGNKYKITINDKEYSLNTLDDLWELLTLKENE